ncbi:hypothetical protein BDV06DRAFT_225903 [Aspergillus oleicola]
MGVSHLGKAVLVMFGQAFILANVLQPAHGLALEPDFDNEDYWTPAGYKRDDGDASGEDWVDLEAYPVFRLHPNCAGYMDLSSGQSESGSESGSGSDSGSISEATKAWFAKMIGNVIHLNKEARGIIPNLRETLDQFSDGEIRRSDMSNEAKSHIDLFMSLYGKFKPDDHAAVKRAKDQVEFLANFVDRYIEGLELNAFNIDIICDYKLWKNAKYANGSKSKRIFHPQLFIKHSGKAGFDREHIAGFKLVNEPMCPFFPPKSDQQLDVCKGRSGENTIMAFSAKTRGDSKNYITICPLAWDHFTNDRPYGDSLEKWYAKGFGGLEWKSLEQIVRLSPEGVLTHELSHSDAYWGSSKLEDIKLKAGGPSAYGFENVERLGQQDKSESNLNNVDALKNAETYEFWSAAGWLRQCNWSSSVCMDPDDPDSEESDPESPF